MAARARHGKSVARPAPGSHRHKASRSSKKSGKSHRTRTASSRRPHSAIYQDISGKVVLERFSGPPVFGPFLPAELHNYPQPPCEPVDAVVEVKLHDPEGDIEGPEGQTAEMAEETGSKPADSLARIARKVGSFFRPKSSEAVVKPKDVDLTELISQAFQIPVEGVDAEKLRDSFLSSRGRHRQHLAIDIGAPRGTPVLATIDGEIVRVVRERRGGKSIYQKDATGQYLLFYCHLSRYADELSVGRTVKKGEVIGFVGSTGHVIGGPHLHFSITRLPEDAGSFKQGLAINPYLLFLAGVP